MSIKWIRQILFFVLLILLQVWVFNKIHLFGVATPLFYIFFILKLPSDTNRNIVVLLAFALGLSIDALDYTLGLHALASVVGGFMRHYALRLFSSRDMPDLYTPSMKTLGMGSFMRYAGFITLLHHIVFFTAESLSLFDPLALLLEIVGSFTLTMLLIFAVEGINFDFLRK